MALLPMLIMVAVLGAIVFAIIVGTSRNKAMAAPAQLLGVREVTVGADVQHWVRFRFVDGRDLELFAEPHQARALVPGQRGTLRWSGGQLTGWVPELGTPHDHYHSG